MQRLDSKNVLSDEQQFSLTKLSISLVAVFLAYWVFSRLGEAYLARVGPRSSDLTQLVSQVVFPRTALFVLLEMLIVIWVYRPIGSLFRYGSRAPAGKHPLLYDVFVGIGAGLLVSAATFPLLWGLKTRFFINSIFPVIHPIALPSVLFLLLYGLALPVATEMVFRGIVLRTLQAYASPAAAILVSTVLFATLWPVFNFLIALVLGTVTGLLYRWRRSLVAAIVANSVMTISAGTYVLWLIWR